MNVLNMKWQSQKYRDEEPGGGGGGGGGPAEITMESLKAAVNPDVWNEAASTLSDIKTPDDLVKGFASAQRMLGSSTRIPGEDAGEDAWNKFYEKMGTVKGIIVAKDDAAIRKGMGVPDEPAGYKVDLSSLPEEVQVEQAELDAKRELWHKMGYSPAQADAAAKMWMEEIVSEAERWKQSNLEGEKALREQLGVTYDEKMGNVNYVTKHVLDKEDVDYLRVTGALTRPGIVKALSDLGQQFRDNGSIEAARQRSVGYTPAEAKAQIAEIRGNPDYTNPHSPNHKALVAKMESLYKMAYPE